MKRALLSVIGAVLCVAAAACLDFDDQLARCENDGRCGGPVSGFDAGNGQQNDASIDSGSNAGDAGDASTEGDGGETDAGPDAGCDVDAALCVVNVLPVPGHALSTVWVADGGEPIYVGGEQRTLERYLADSGWLSIPTPMFNAPDAGVDVIVGLNGDTLYLYSFEEKKVFRMEADGGYTGLSSVTGGGFLPTCMGPGPASSLIFGGDDLLRVRDSSGVYRDYPNPLSDSVEFDDTFAALGGVYDYVGVGGRTMVSSTDAGGGVILLHQKLNPDAGSADGGSADAGFVFKVVSVGRVTSHLRAAAYGFDASVPDRMVAVGDEGEIFGFALGGGGVSSTTMLRDAGGPSLVDVVYTADDDSFWAIGDETILRSQGKNGAWVDVTPPELKGVSLKAVAATPGGLVVVGSQVADGGEVFGEAFQLERR